MGSDGLNIAICGYPRSGSTMFYNMLRATVLGYRFTDKEVSATEALCGDWPVISKFPSDCFRTQEITALDPDVGFIVTLRDPRSVLCSKHKTTGDLYKVSWDKTLHGKKRLGRHKEHWGLLVWDAALDCVPHPHWLKYEDLIAQPATEQTRLAHKFGIKYSGLFADFWKSDIPVALQKQLNGVRPIDTSRLAPWWGHPERIKSQFEECPELHDIVIRRGYEEDTSWIRNL